MKCRSLSDLILGDDYMGLPFNEVAAICIDELVNIHADSIAVDFTDVNSVEDVTKSFDENKEVHPFIAKKWTDKEINNSEPWTIPDSKFGEDGKKIPYTLQTKRLLGVEKKLVAEKKIKRDELTHVFEIDTACLNFRCQPVRKVMWTRTSNQLIDARRQIFDAKIKNLTPFQVMAWVDKLERSFQDTSELDKGILLNCKLVLGACTPLLRARTHTTALLKPHPPHTPTHTRTHTHRPPHITHTHTCARARTRTICSVPPFFWRTRTSLTDTVCYSVVSALFACRANDHGHPGQRFLPFKSCNATRADQHSGNIRCQDTAGPHLQQRRAGGKLACTVWL